MRNGFVRQGRTPNSFEVVPDEGKSLLDVSPDLSLENSRMSVHELWR
jgi:hypothetical protein